MQLHIKAWGNSQGTVSYTHLDVYKRQDLINPAVPAFSDGT